jgi:ZIP family zinc transporter
MSTMPSALPLLVAAATVGSTAAGGLVALRVRDRMHLVLGLSAGVLLGLVAFDLLPEVFELSDAVFLGVPAVMAGFVAGFMILHVVERGLAVHETADSHHADHRHTHQHVGALGAGALVVHSFLDGVAIGLGFQVSTATGWVVALAVLAHDFADGLNTVTIMRRHGQSRAAAVRMLVADAVAPFLGAASTLLFTLPDQTLAIYLAMFAGFLTYLAAADILPEAHAQHPSRATLAMTFAGLGLMWFVAGVSG